MLINPDPVIVGESFVKDYDALYKESIANPEAFWEKLAKELSWDKPWDKVLDWQYPYARWFVGAKTNIVANAIDRHLSTPAADKVAMIWVAQPTDSAQKDEVVTYTYKQLNEQVSKFANGLKSLGVKKGDKVMIYMPRVPEQFIAMLASLKIGAVHSVVYSGFSATALKTRVTDASAKVLVCTNGYPYGKKTVDSKANVDEALKDNKTIEHVIVVDRLKNGSGKTTPRDMFWSELVEKQSPECPTEMVEATDPAFILYTSGTTGTPKGVVHAHGGYMVGIYATLKLVFNIKPDDVFWCTADAGWITGHSYILYSPLINGVTTFIYEGTPTYPDIEIWWKLIDNYKITKFYTAPTAVRSLMKFGEEPLKKYRLSSLKILGSVGEPINPEAWLWFYKYVGHEKCPIMDTWWQTETGMHMITPVPSVGLKPGSAFKPFFGIEADVVDEKGNKVPPNTQGYLIIKKPWPAMLLDVYNNSKRYHETYFEKIPDVYFSGDSAKIDEDGYFWIVGRNDDVIKVSGHRLGSAELESAFVSHPKVAEAAVIGKPDDVKGESIKAFIILKQGITGDDVLKDELKQLVRKEIGPIATPDAIDFVDKLPKTRSGKIMRRVLKAQELGQPVGDVSTLED
ncbi:acetate--CoA ligase [Patescibacteria group bacterium]|nr:acetate--CoA ligase [Patescibacteria group bacterium]